MKTAKELKAQATETFNDIFGLSYEKPSDIRDYLLYKIFSFNHEAKQELSVNGRSKDFWVAVEKWSFIYSESLVKEEIKTFALSCGYNLITEEEYAQNSGYTLTTEREEEHNLRLCSGSGKGQFVKLNDVAGIIKDGTLLNKEFCALPFPMTEDEVRQLVLSAGYNFFSWHGGYILNEKYYYTLADVVDTVKKGELLSGESCAIAIIEEEAFIKVREYSLSCGYILTKLNNEYCQFNVCSNSGRIGQFTKLEGVTEVIKEGRLLIGEACAIANLNNLEEENKINLRIDGKMVAINLDVHHEIKLSHDPVFGWQLVGVDSQVLREPLNVEDKTQPTLKFKTRESASRFAAKLAAKVKNIKEDRVREYKQRAIKEFMVKVNNA